MTQEHNQMNFNEMCREAEKSHKRGKVAGGILIVAIGSLFLLKEVGVELPYWLLSWKTLLISLGIITGIKHSFKNALWFVLVAIGGISLLGDFYPELNIKHFIWPIVLIFFGLMVIFKPHRKHHQYWKRAQRRYNRYERFKHDCSNDTKEGEDYFESTSFMGGVQKTVLSKKFKGADITNVFGGAEINLSQADMESTARMELTNVFGGTKLIIPPHWEIKSELTSVFGSIEDKRPIQPIAPSDKPKILILEGTTFMGGIDIKSY